jgi:hypothetical protein
MSHTARWPYYIETALGEEKNGRLVSDVSHKNCCINVPVSRPNLQLNRYARDK